MLHKMENQSLRIFLDSCAAKGFVITNILKDEESHRYDAYTMMIEGKKIVFRQAHATPKKIGFFVTLWKRVSRDIAPYDVSDAVDFVVIAAHNDEQRGYFIFPRSILLQKNIISEDGIGGKRGIRVYAPWNTDVHLMAQKSRLWQIDYFHEVAVGGELLWSF